jgi:hypothetical protein
MQIEKQFGKGAVMRMGDDTASRDIQTVSTGSLTLDIALGVGGLPSALGVKAATESITTISTALERTNISAISSACSPVSG